MTFPIEKIRADFPILDQEVNGRPLVYLDNAATGQKPQAVIDALDHYYKLDNSNIHRGVHALSERATAAYEGARDKARAFLNAKSRNEIIFVRGTTEAINLVAQAHVRPLLSAGDVIVITHLEHHSNIVPWQLLAEQTGAKVVAVEINEKGELKQDHYRELLTLKPKFVSLGHVSNGLGTINPVKTMIAEAHAAGAQVMIDGAQATPHMAVDVQDLDADFYALSGHKVYGPTGIGVLYGKEALLDAAQPYQGGGEMIKVVSLNSGTTYNELPHKFEAGTPHIAGAVGLGAAFDYLTEIGLDNIAAWEHDLLEYANKAVAQFEDLTIIGQAEQKAGILSFTMEGMHPQDIGTIIDQYGVAIRAGHHCAMPALECFGLTGTARASLALYNTREDIDRFVEGMHKVVSFLKI